MDREALNCPFCDGTAQIVTITHELTISGLAPKNFYYVECFVCYARTHRAPQLDRALQNWNRRIEK